MTTMSACERWWDVDGDLGSAFPVVFGVLSAAVAVAVAAAIKPSPEEIASCSVSPLWEGDSLGEAPM